jgi:predicted deacetylase
VTPPLLAICLHDVEHDTLDRCRSIRQWLGDRCADRITLLAIPDGRRGPLVADDDCARWLRERAAAGDAIAQHGLHHRRSQRAGRARDWVADRQGGTAAEFVGLTPSQTIAAVHDGHTLLQAAGLHPRGFVAPAYAYTSALRRELHRRFDWHAALLVIHGPRPLYAPAHGLGTSTTFKRRTSPTVIRAGARLTGRLLRVDVHPADFDLPCHLEALDAVLRKTAGRRPVTYDDLSAGVDHPPPRPDLG